jgi:hypothetical protein
MPNLCCFENCRKRAYFGENKKCVVCKEHNTNNWSDIISSKCFCGKASKLYNFEGLKPMYCSLCKKDEMINCVVSKKCGCGNIARFNYLGESPKFCIDCKNTDMINVIQTKCKCKKTIPTYNYEGLKPEFCSSCKEPDMTNVRQKKCGCGTIASFNYKGKSPEFCFDCKKPDMVNLRSKKCICGKYLASFNFTGLSAKYCSSCKEEGMICLNIKKCKNEGCTVEGNKKYKNYCTYCFQHLFPLDPLTFQIRCKTKELAVRDFINSNFEGFQHDKTLEYGGCDCLNRRRIDHRKLINNTLLCIETDENQHKQYSKKDEHDRYNDLLTIFTCKYIFIRFNPDSYKDKNGKKCNPSISTRLLTLKEEIDKQIKYIQNEENNDLLEIKYVYFDNFN